MTMGVYSLLHITSLLSLLCFLQSLKGIVGSVSCPSHISDMKKTHKAVYKNTCYLFVDTEVFWSTARTSCWDLGGEMLTIKDGGTMKFIRDKLNALKWGRNGVWLGLHYHRKVWMWTDGSLMTYENWASGQPSKYLSFLSVEECAQMRKSENWKWFDHVCGGISFHFNYICQFPAEVAHTTATLTTASKKNEIKDYSKTVATRNHQFRELSSESDQGNSSHYQNLGHNVYRLMKEKGLSSKSLIKLIQESAMGEVAGVTDPEQVTSRVSSSASNQQEDNGNMKIVIIVVSLTGGFLLILFILFLLMRRHNKIVKAKAAERAVRYENNHSTDNSARVVAAPTRPATRLGGEDQRPPPIPASRPPPVDEMYLAPKDINGMYTEVLRPNGMEPHCSNPNSYHVVSTTPVMSQSINSNSELGACGVSDETEERSPLMLGHTLNSIGNNHMHHNGTANKGPTESCACTVGSESVDNEYIAMNSLVSKECNDNESNDNCSDKMINPEDKHTYSNVHLGGKESGAVENLYETLP